MQIVIHLIATVSEAYTSLLAAYNHFTNVTWKVTDKPRFQWKLMFFQHAPQPRITHRKLVTLVARPEEGMFKTIFEAIWHLLTTTKVVKYFSYSTGINMHAQFFFYLNINQLDALNFIMSLFHASTCFEHMCSSSGGQNCTIQPLVWLPDDKHTCSKHVESWNKLITKFSASRRLILR